MRHFTLITWTKSEHHGLIEFKRRDLWALFPGREAPHNSLPFPRAESNFPPEPKILGPTHHLTPENEKMKPENRKKRERERGPKFPFLSLHYLLCGKHRFNKKIDSSKESALMGIIYLTYLAFSFWHSEINFSHNSYLPCP